MKQLKSRAIYIVLLVMLALFGVSAVVSSIRFWERENALWRTQIDSSLWHASQLERAYQDVLETALRIEARPEEAGLNDLVQRLDVLWSRLKLISDVAPEPRATMYRQHREIFADLEDRLNSIDQLVSRARGGNRASVGDVYALLEPLRDPLHNVTLGGLRTDTQQDDRTRTELQEVAEVLSVDIIAIGLCGLAIVLLLFRQVGREERANRQARSATEMLRQAVDGIPEGFGLFDQRDKLVICNRAFLEMSGFDEEREIAGKTFRELIAIGQSRGHYGRADRSPADWAKWRVDNHHSGAESHYALANGQWVLARDIPMPNGGIVCLRSDITAHKETEDKLRTALHESRNATQAKSEFLAIMSHEMRTPLNGVLGLLGLLLDSELDPEQRGYALTARESGEMLLSLIEDILDFSKIEAGKLTLEDTEFNPGEIVQAVVELLASKAHAKGIEIACYVDRSVPAQLRGDPGRLRQVLLNLAGNAVKFTERGGVTVELSMVAEEGEEVTLSGVVTDTGIGIPYEAQDGLFLEFNQIDASYSRRFGGTGLGLAISRRLVEAMNGAIRVRSEPDRGSVFSFTVQLRRGAEAIPAPVAANDLPRRRILFWGEGGITSSLLVRTLRSDGHNVTAVRTANEALARMSEEDLDAILIDGRPQDETGLRLVEMLRQKGCDLPIFLLRPYGMQTPYGKDGRDIGVTGIVSKPIKRDDLARVMTTLSADTLLDDARRRAGQADQHNVGEGYRILLAEDSSTNRMVAAALLRRAAYRVDWVIDGAEALEAVKRLPYDLILMDISMPNMDGIEATKAIRALPGEESQVPIVALTAHAMPGDKERFLSAGMDAYLTKPLQARELIETIMRFCPAFQGRNCKAARAKEQDVAGEAILLHKAAHRADKPPAKAETNPSEDSSPIVDEFVLKQLRQDAGEQAVPQLIEVFLNELSGRVERICEAQAGNDKAMIAKEAHALKSSAGSFGAMRLHLLAKNLEFAAREEQGDTVSELVSRLPGLGREAAEKFRTLLA